jgi:hypothetical protein
MNLGNSKCGSTLRDSREFWMAPEMHGSRKGREELLGRACEVISPGYSASPGQTSCSPLSCSEYSHLHGIGMMVLTDGQLERPKGNLERIQRRGPEVMKWLETRASSKVK